MEILETNSCGVRILLSLGIVFQIVDSRQAYHSLGGRHYFSLSSCA